MTDLFTEWKKEFRTSPEGTKALRELKKLKTFAVETERKRSADIRLDEAAGIAPKSEAVASLRDELKARETAVVQQRLVKETRHLQAEETANELVALGRKALQANDIRMAEAHFDQAFVIRPESEHVAKLREDLETHKLKERETRVELLCCSLESRVLKSCYMAKCFNNGDRLTKLRDQDKRVMELIPDQLKAVKAIREFIREFPMAASRAYAFGAPSGPKEPAYFWVEFHDNVSRDCSQALDAVLAKYASGLSEPIKCGPFLHRYQYGCLLYQAPIDDVKNRPDPFTLLLYELTLFFRAFTSKKITGSFMRAVQIHPELVAQGKPCYWIAWQFAVAALGDPDAGIQRRSKPDHRAKKRIGGFLKHHPTVQYVGW